MDPEPEVAIAYDLGLGGMQAHPHAHVNILWPVVSGVDTLRRDRRRDGILCPGEDSKERLTLCIHLAARVLVERRTHQPVVFGQQFAVIRPQLLEQTGRSLDVGEEKCDRAARRNATSLSG